MAAAPPADVIYADRALYLDEEDILVLSDLHVGRDAVSNVELPLGERRDLVDRLQSLLQRFEPAEVIFAGDLLHSFDTVPAGASETVCSLVDAASEIGASVTVTPGNHDTRLGAIPHVPRVDEHRLDDGTVVCHGHELPEAAGADRYIVGHEHPAIVVEGVRRPCFLFGEAQFQGVDVLVLPAFSRLAAGTPVSDLRAGSALSPLLADPDELQPVVVSEGEPLTFPPLADLRSVL